MATAEKDFVELLRLFNKHQVRYSIIGAFAVGYHALPRYTKDLDVLVEPSPENAKNIVTALREFGFGSLRLIEKDFIEKNQVIQLGYEPVRIDLITSLKGLSFEQVWKNKKKGILGTEPAYFMGLGELIKAKQAAGRKQDLADLEILTKKQKSHRPRRKPKS